MLIRASKSVLDKSLGCESTSGIESYLVTNQGFSCFHHFLLFDPQPSAVRLYRRLTSRPVVKETIFETSRSLA